MALKYTVVPDTERSERNYADDPAVVELLAGKTLEIQDFPKSSTYYKVATKNNMKLHTRTKSPGVSIVWMEPVEGGVYPETQVSITSIEAEKVTA